MWGLGVPFLTAQEQYSWCQAALTATKHLSGTRMDLEGRLRTLFLRDQKSKKELINSSRWEGLAFRKKGQVVGFSSAIDFPTILQCGDIPVCKWHQDMAGLGRRTCQQPTTWNEASVRLSSQKSPSAPHLTECPGSCFKAAEGLIPPDLPPSSLLSCPQHCVTLCVGCMASPLCTL